MAAPAQQQQGDNSLGPFWIIVGIFFLGWMIWIFGHAQITSVVFQLRLWEGYLINLFTDHVAGTINIIKTTPPEAVTFNQLADVSTQIGNYLRYPILIILFLLAVAVYFSHNNLRYKKSYSMQTLVDEEKISWPQITPVAKLDLVKADIDKGPWAMALPPMQFAKKNQLLQIERILPSDAYSRKQAKLVATVRKEEAHRVFALQLGRYWTGINDLNIHTKALFAVFAARANRDREGAIKLLKQIAASTSSGKLDFSGTEELLNKHKNFKGVVKVMQSHAFVLTVMASMLVLARTDGVLASADFLWLKPVDRPLWFMLNSVGRQTPFTEVAGPFAHWVAERLSERKLFVPMVDEAVKALEVAIAEILYVPDEDE